MDYDEDYDPESSIDSDTSDEMGAAAYDYSVQFTSDGTVEEPTSEGT